MLLQVLLRPNRRQHQQLRRGDGPRAQNHLLRRPHQHRVPLRQLQLHSPGLGAFQHNPGHEGLGGHGQVGEPLADQWLDEGIEGVGAAAGGQNGELGGGCSLHLGPVVVAGGGDAVSTAGLDKILHFCHGRRHPGRHRPVKPTVLGVRGVPALEQRRTGQPLQALEVGKHRLVGPIGPAPELGSPPVKILGRTPDPHPVVQAGRSPQGLPPLQIHHPAPGIIGVGQLGLRGGAVVPVHLTPPEPQHVVVGPDCRSILGLAACLEQ
mmetsp:Transcript_19885/g.44243  ORF Transcript_19885/g.44243 Transcript_19885/m.44243 type:complete len:265 (+) Transcript_19885:1205-1999(+)